MTRDEQAKRVEEIVDRVRPFIAGHSPAIQGAVLADLVAIWLAGHMGPDGVVDKYRDKILADLVDTVRKLVPVNESILRERHGL